MQIIDDELSSDRLRDQLEWQFQRERRRRRSVALVVAPAFLGVLGVMFVFLSGYRISNILLLVTLALFGVSGTGLLMLYLQTGFKKIEPTASSDDASYAYHKEIMSIRRQLSLLMDRDTQGADRAAVATLRNDVERLQREVTERIQAASSAQVFSDADRKNLLDSLRHELEADGAKNVLEELRRTFEQNSSVRDASDRIGSTVGRLREETFSLGRRANLNLVIGIATTISGLAILGYFVFEIKGHGDVNTVLLSFLPRLSLVVFIEVFAYFFLRLYKTSLDEIKYFQNELTNIESRGLALQVAMQTGDTNTCSRVACDLSVTERNRIFGKDQTTLELETHKIDREAIIDVVKAVTDAIGGQRKQPNK